jgi:hypothetical protein
MFEDTDQQLTETYGDIPTMFDLHNVSNADRLEALKNPPTEDYALTFLVEIPSLEFHYHRSLWDFLTGKEGRATAKHTHALKQHSVILRLTQEQTDFFIKNKEVILRVANHIGTDEQATFLKL